MCASDYKMVSADKPLDFEGIYLQGKQQKSNGKIKFVPSGAGWKESATGAVTTLRSEEFKKALWTRVAREYQLRIVMKNGTEFNFDGFSKESFDTLKNYMKDVYGMTLENRELGLKGRNWGKAQIDSHHLEFVVQGRIMFELPVQDIGNSTVSAKNEVTIELVPTTDTSSNKKQDSLVDIRLYIPSVDGEQEQDDDETESKKSIDPATLFCNNIKSIIDSSTGGALGAIVESISSFQEVPFLVPRGRYEVDMYSSSIRLRGKSYDYKIPYTHLLKIFALPKPDDIHIYVILALDPPLRQGQTRYPFLIIQFPRDQDIEISPTIPSESRALYAGKLEKHYEGSLYEVFTTILKALSDKKVLVPGSFRSYQGTSCIKCSIKANEGHIYFMEKNIIFVPKPCILISHEDLTSVTFSRVDGALSSRTFDISITVRGGTIHQFSNVMKEELSLIEEYLKDKKIKFQNELIIQKKTKYADTDEDEDEDIPELEDELDDESTDEDYQEGDSEDDDDDDYEENDSEEDD